jgi:hypothetical protein
LLDADTLKTKAVFKTGARPNGAAIVNRKGLGIAACIGDEHEAPTLQSLGLNNRKQVAIDLPGRPPGLVDTIDPRTGRTVRTTTAAGAHTTVLVPPDRLYVISPRHGGILVLADS